MDYLPLEEQLEIERLEGEGCRNCHVDEGGKEIKNLMPPGFKDNYGLIPPLEDDGVD